MKNNWPALNLTEIIDTFDTVHQWIQIVGKIRLKTMPWQNHSWHTTLYVTSTGFSTQSIPFQGRIFQIDFDFKQHKLIVDCSNAQKVSMDLKPMTVADFYEKLFSLLSKLGIEVFIHQKPNELAEAIPFKENTRHKSYDKNGMETLWMAMLRANEVFSKFRSDFVGKSSPVHLFWGGFDLALTRFSGRKAPLHQGSMPNMPKEVMQEAYSQEVFSVGFWPGSKEFPQPSFYAYCYPTPNNFKDQEVKPEEAFYSNEMGEFMLKYDDVISAKNPEQFLLDFLNSTYEAAAKVGDWNREMLEY